MEIEIGRRMGERNRIRAADSGEEYHRAGGAPEIGQHDGEGFQSTEAGANDVIHIIHANGKGAEVDIPPDTTSDEYGDIHEAFCAQHAPGATSASIVKRQWNQVINGVFYDWGLSGPDGAWYQLFQWAENSDETVREASAKLRREQDVVRLWVTKLKRVAFEIPQTIASKGD